MDKGNTVVALDRVDYTNKMENILSDTDTYKSIQRNLMNKLIEDYKKILKQWSQNNYTLRSFSTKIY